MGEKMRPQRIGLMLTHRSNIYLEMLDCKTTVTIRSLIKNGWLRGKNRIVIGNSDNYFGEREATDES